MCTLFEILNELVDVLCREILTPQRTRGNHSLQIDTLRLNTDTSKYSFYPPTFAIGIVYPKCMHIAYRLQVPGGRSREPKSSVNGSWPST